MTYGFLFWLLMILWVLGYAGIVWGSAPPWALHASSLLLFVLLLLLGLHDFGWPIHA